MLEQPLIEKLYDMKLNGMAAAFEEQRREPAAADLSFDDRFGLLVERQYLYKEERALRTRLHFAGLKDSGACIEDINYRLKRDISRDQVEALIAPEWLRQGRNALITGATGLGKSNIAEARPRPACRNGCRRGPRRQLPDRAAQGRRGRPSGRRRLRPGKGRSAG